LIFSPTQTIKVQVAFFSASMEEQQTLDGKYQQKDETLNRLFEKLITSPSATLDGWLACRFVLFFFSLFLLCFYQWKVWAGEHSNSCVHNTKRWGWVGSRTARPE